jgi:hypothetical protein
MNRKALAVIPAALVPVAIFASEHLQLGDAASGLVAGVLIGLSLVALLAPRRCLPAAAG